jgi:hypothetical protein
LREVGMKFLLVVLCAGCGGGTALAPVDARAELNQQRAAVAIIARSDGGAVESLAGAIYCSAGGTLRRAGAPQMDAGVACP